MSEKLPQGMIQAKISERNGGDRFDQQKQVEATRLRMQEWESSKTAKEGYVQRNIRMHQALGDLVDNQNLQSGVVESDNIGDTDTMVDSSQETGIDSLDDNLNVNDSDSSEQERFAGVSNLAEVIRQISAEKGAKEVDEANLCLDCLNLIADDMADLRSSNESADDLKILEDKFQRLYDVYEGSYEQYFDYSAIDKILNKAYGSASEEDSVKNTSQASEVIMSLPQEPEANLLNNDALDVNGSNDTNDKDKTDQDLADANKSIQENGTIDIQQTPEDVVNDDISELYTAMSERSSKVEDVIKNVEDLNLFRANARKVFSERATNLDGYKKNLDEFKADIAALQADLFDNSDNISEFDRESYGEELIGEAIDRIKLEAEVGNMDIVQAISENESLKNLKHGIDRLKDTGFASGMDYDKAVKAYSEQYNEVRSYIIDQADKSSEVKAESPILYKALEWLRSEITSIETPKSYSESGLFDKIRDKFRQDHDNMNRLKNQRKGLESNIAFAELNPGEHIREYYKRVRRQGNSRLVAAWACLTV